MLLSQQPVNTFGCRQQAIHGHKEIAKRAIEVGADTIVVLNTHWLVNAMFPVD